MIETATVKKINEEIYIVAELLVYLKDKDFWIVDSNDELLFIDEPKAVNYANKRVNVVVQSSCKISDNIPIVEDKTLSFFQSKENGYTFNVELYIGNPKSIGFIMKLINKNKNRKIPGRITENDSRYRNNYLERYATKVSGAYLPVNGQISEFVEHYYARYKEMGQQVYMA